jgi:WD40 repeat protein
VENLAFSADGSMLAAVSRTSLQLWRVFDGVFLRTIDAYAGIGGFSRMVADEADFVMTSVAFSPSGMMLATGLLDGSVRLWKISDGTCVRRLKGGEGATLSVAFSRDGSLLATGWGLSNKVLIWRATDGKLVRTIDDVFSPVSIIEFSPDGETLVTGRKLTGWVAIWRVSDGKRLWSHERYGHSNGRTCGNGDVRGFTDSALALVFSPQGAIIVAGAYDATVWFR